MFFGSRYALGVLREGEGEGAGGGKGQEQPLTLAAIAALMEQNNAKLRTDWKKEQDDAEAKRKAEADRQAAEAEERRKAAEAEQLRLDEEKRAANGGADQQTKYEISKLQRLVDEERKKREASEAQSLRQQQEMAEKDRISSIRGALGNYQFGKNGLESAFRYVKDEIKRDDNGQLVGPNGAPLQDYLNDLFRTGGELEHNLAPRAGGGSGAHGSQATGGTGAIDMDSIKAGKNNELAREAIAKLTRDIMGGR